MESCSAPTFLYSFMELFCDPFLFGTLSRVIINVDPRREAIFFIRIRILSIDHDIPRGDREGGGMVMTSSESTRVAKSQFMGLFRKKSCWTLLLSATEYRSISIPRGRTFPQSALPLLLIKYHGTTRILHNTYRTYKKLGEIFMHSKFKVVLSK